MEDNIIKWIAGVVLGLLSLLYKHNDSRINKLDIEQKKLSKEVHSLDLLIAKNYPTKEDLNGLEKRICDKLDYMINKKG